MGQHSLQYVGPNFEFDNVPLPRTEALAEKNSREVSAKLHALDGFAKIGQSIVIERNASQVKQALQRLLESPRRKSKNTGFLIEPMPAGKSGRARCRVFKTK